MEPAYLLVKRLKLINKYGVLLKNKKILEDLREKKIFQSNKVIF